MITLGSLKLTLALERPELLGETVTLALQQIDVSGVLVAEIDPTLSDTAAFCDHYGVGMDVSANCVVLEAKRADKQWFAACVILGSTRADINGVARRTLDARKVSFAPIEAAFKESKMEYGAITPVGLPLEWPILVDKAVVEKEYLIIGSGVRGSKLAVPGSFFAKLPNVQIIENLAQAKQ